MLYHLVDYITQEPQASASHQEAYKFPYASSTFFCMEFGSVLKQFFHEPELLEKLLKFLRVDEEPLPVLAGYFAKACEALLVISPQQFLREFYQSRSHMLLCHHLSLSSLSELLLKLLCFSANYEEFYGCLTETLDILIVALKGPGKSILMANTQQALVRFIQNPNATVPRNFKIFENFYLDMQNTADSTSMLRSFFCSPVTLTLLFSNLSDKSIKEPACIKANLQVLLSIFTKYVMSTDFDTTILDLFADNLCVIHESLLDTPARFSDVQQVCLEIIKLLCSVNHSRLHEKIADSRILITITDIFERFPWSSVMHNSYLSIVSAILICEPSVLRKHLLDHAKIVDLIVRHARFPMVKSKNCMVRKGFMAHLHTMANMLLKLADYDSYLENILDNTEGWYDFVSNALVKQNLIENKQLGSEDYADFFDKPSSGDESEPGIEELKNVRIGEQSEQEILEQLQSNLENLKIGERSEQEILEQPQSDLENLRIGEKSEQEILEPPLSDLEVSAKSEEKHIGYSDWIGLGDELQTEEKYTHTSYWRVPIEDCLEDLV